MNLIRSPEYLISIIDSGNTAALTAPLIMKERVLIGFALGPEESHCLDISLNEFKMLSSDLYLRVHSPRVYYGLKRIWEAVDERSLRLERAPENGEVSPVP